MPATPTAPVVTTAICSVVKLEHPGSTVAELALRALRAVEDDLVVGVEVGAPAILIRR
jgi:hypothetical protein